MSPTLIDLDELVLRCRSPQGREYIREAVQSYKAGAFRSAIVATWIAVVLDYIHKLRELELAGDRNARVKLAAFEQVRSKGEAGVKEAMAFERGVLADAADEFELLTPLERKDLERLYEDRNRCAHPSMQSLDDPYQPAAELARMHIRNAVEILLRREPVQGTAALTRIWGEIGSTYFPTDAAGARLALESGPLMRARTPLVRNVVIGLTKSLLGDERPAPERQRQLAALNAAVEMYRAVGEQVLEEQLPALVSGVPDASWPRVIRYIRRVAVSWMAIGQALQAKAQAYVSNVCDKQMINVLDDALHMPPLRAAAITRLPKLDELLLRVLILASPLHEVVDSVVVRIENTKKYTEIKAVRDYLLVPACPHLQAEQVQRLVAALTANPYVTGYKGWGGLVSEVADLTHEHATVARAGWEAVYSRLCEPNQRGYETLRVTIRSWFPDLPVPTWPEQVEGIASDSASEPTVEDSAEVPDW